LVIGDYVIEKDDANLETAVVTNLDSAVATSGGKTSAWSHFGALAQTYGDDYKIVEHKKYPANWYRLQILKEILSEINPSLVLDVGCGSGEPMIDFIKSGHAVMGIDRSSKMVAKCRENLVAADLDPTLVAFGDMEAPEGLPRESFDCLVALGAVYYAEEFKKTIQGLTELLPPGGHFVFSLRNELFSLFSLNRYTKNFFQDRLIPYEKIDGTLKSRVDSFFSERFERLEQKRQFETVDTLGVHSIVHNPLTVEKEVLEPAGLDLISLSFYHYHPLPPTFEHTNPEVFRTLAAAHEVPDDWRGNFMASSFVVHARKRHAPGSAKPSDI
jgi:SAM-dependent methyltransferase